MRKMSFLCLFIFLISSLNASPRLRRPSNKEQKQIRKFAYQLKVDTDEAYIESILKTSFSAEEELAIHKLYLLKISAWHFAQQAHVYSYTSSYENLDWLRLNEAFFLAREDFLILSSFAKFQPLFETIIDTMGNLRYYYTAADTYHLYPDHEIYPYYPGYSGFVHVIVKGKNYHYRHKKYWHKDAKHYSTFPHRNGYRYGYGRHRTHYHSLYRNKYRHHSGSYFTHTYSRHYNRAYRKYSSNQRTYTTIRPLGTPVQTKPLGNTFKPRPLGNNFKPRSRGNK